MKGISEYVFVSTETDTVETVSGSCYIIDLDKLTDADADVLGDADMFGFFGDDAVAIVRRVGIPVAELMAAYVWRESLRDAGILDEIENHVVRCYENMDVQV